MHRGTDFEKVVLHDYTHPHQTAPLPESVARGFPALVSGQTIYAGFDASASGNSAIDYFAAFLWEHPKRFNKAVLDFIARHRGR